MSRVVVDLGATHARFARVGEGRTLAAITLAAEDYASLIDLLRHGLALAGGDATALALAIAAPVHGPTIQMTNRAWSFAPSELRAALRVDTLVVLNDFEAVAWALSALTGADHATIGGPRSPDTRAPRLALGPGTGLGVSLAVPSTAGWTVIATEGGHATLAVHDATEARVLEALRGAHRRVSAEALLCGPGLLRLHAVLSRLDGQERSYDSPALLTDAAHAGDPLALRAIRVFLRWLAGHAGDLALSTGARGGVFLTGGVLGHLSSWIDEDEFRAAFEDKAPMSAWLKDVPTSRLTIAEPGLVGAARALEAARLIRDAR